MYLNLFMGRLTCGLPRTCLVWAVVLAAPLKPAADGNEKDSVPAWVKHDLPEWVMPYVGKRGLSDPWPHGSDLGAGELVGIDLWQANNFVVHRSETAEFLYGEYTPTKLDYKAGTFPALEEIVARHTAGSTSDRDKAVNLLTRAMPALLRHPALPPYKSLRVDRNFDEPVRAAYAASFARILAMSDAEMGGAAVRQEMVAREELVCTLHIFGVLNYPLPH